MPSLLVACRKGTGMTDMEAKAREIAHGIELDPGRKRELLFKALTEAHLGGMEEAAKVRREMPMPEKAPNGCYAAWLSAQEAMAAAIQEKIKPIHAAEENPTND